MFILSKALEIELFLNLVEESKGAPCKGNPEVFIPMFFTSSTNKTEKTNTSNFEADVMTLKAQALCSTCTAQLTCLHYAIATRQHDGTWGGCSARERVRIRHLFYASYNSKKRNIETLKLICEQYLTTKSQKNDSKRSNKNTQVAQKKQSKTS